MVDAANLLTKAAAQARTLGDKRAEAYALSTLAELYGLSAESNQQPKQWAEVENLSRQALLLAQESNAPDIAYRLQRQLGRALKIQGKDKEARAAYKVAVQSLQNLRKDLVAINQDVQFTFRDSVEPIYREAVAVLLPAAGETSSQQDLEDARQTLEYLQLAELDNFFREACIEGRKVKLDELAQENPTTAFIYPIILSKQQLGVIAKIPKQDLRYETAKDDDIEKTLNDLREQLEDPTKNIFASSTAAKVYEWLIAPFDAQLKESKADTLVFVLDGAFRNVPMAALYNNAEKKYLVEDYAIALNPGLQLIDPKPIARKRLDVLAAGLIETPKKYGYRVLNEVEAEFKLMAELGILTQKPLREQDFTREALAEKINAIPFNVVHLATHAEFSSRLEETFILTDNPPNGRTVVTQLSEILQSRNRTRQEAIELLVLSACYTAQGNNRATLGLAGIAIRSGARSTLASLWTATDAPTAALMGKFYKALTDSNNNVTKAKALQAAQLELLKDYSEPTYWAPYVLVGNWL